MARVSDTGQLITRSGQPVRMDTGPERGRHAGVTITATEDMTMAKADKTALYRTGKTHIRVNKGDVIPEGAELIEERKAGPAPENRKLDNAPENRGKASKKDDD